MTGKSKDSSQTHDLEPFEYAFIVEGRPVPKGRPRMSKSGNVYTPSETVRAERDYIHAVGEDHPTYEGHVRVEITFTEENTLVTVKPADDWTTSLRGDLDNYIKLCLDGCQRAGIFDNDRQVVQIDAIKI